WHGSPAGTTPRSVPPSHRYPYRRTARRSMRWFAPSLCCPLLRSGASIVLRTAPSYTKCQAYRQTVRILLGFLTLPNRSGAKQVLRSASSPARHTRCGAARRPPPPPTAHPAHLPTAHPPQPPTGTTTPHKALEGETMFSRRSFVG